MSREHSMPGVVANTEDDPGKPKQGRCTPFTPPKTNMTIYFYKEKSTMNEDVFPIENGDFPMSS